MFSVTDPGLWGRHGCGDHDRVGSLAEKARSSDGQATVEAAFILPVGMILMLLLLQPGILLYDRIVMQGAAAEGCRLLATTTDEVAPLDESYIHRRLSAVPQLDIFHVHSSGCTWSIVLTGSDRTDMVSVSIATEVRPLPLLDIGMELLGMTNERGNLAIEVSSEMPTQPQWVSTSADGREPAQWPQS